MWRFHYSSAQLPERYRTLEDGCRNGDAESQQQMGDLFNTNLQAAYSSVTPTAFIHSSKTSATPLLVAHSLYKNCCKKGIGECCTKFAEHIELDNPESIDSKIKRSCSSTLERITCLITHKRAAGYYQQACDLGDPNGCLALYTQMNELECVFDKEKQRKVMQQAVAILKESVHSNNNNSKLYHNYLIATQIPFDDKIEEYFPFNEREEYIQKALENLKEHCFNYKLDEHRVSEQLKPYQKEVELDDKAKAFYEKRKRFTAVSTQPDLLNKACLWYGDLLCHIKNLPPTVATNLKKRNNLSATTTSKEKELLLNEAYAAYLYGCECKESLSCIEAGAVIEFNDFNKDDLQSTDTTIRNEQKQRLKVIKAFYDKACLIDPATCEEAGRFHETLLPDWFLRGTEPTTDVSPSELKEIETTFSDSIQSYQRCCGAMHQACCVKWRQLSSSNVVDEDDKL